jgi:uncharacterized protein (DUF1697 family)
VGDIQLCDGLWVVMALVVFLRGVNVGGHRTFRPSLPAQELSDYDVVNIGGAGTFVVRKPGSRAKFRAALLRKLPFVSEIALCEGRDLIQLEKADLFGNEAALPELTRFLSILSKGKRGRVKLPITIPADGEWFVRVLGQEGRFVFGVYRRHMRTICCLGQLDKLFGAPATTRNWKTILAVIRILKSAAS